MSCKRLNVSHVSVLAIFDRVGIDNHIGATDRRKRLLNHMPSIPVSTLHCICMKTASDSLEWRSSDLPQSAFNGEHG